VSDARDLRRLLVALRAGVRGLRATPFVFAISVGTMAAGLLLLAGYLLVVDNMRGALDRFGRELRLVAFLSDAAAARNEAEEVSVALRGIDGIAGAAYVSKDRALARLREDLGAEAGILDAMPRNPLPASFEIDVDPRFRKPASLRGLAARVRAIPGVEEVRFGEDWAQSYARLLQALEWIGVGFGGFLLLALGAIVAGTVRLAVHARADEIEIQRLVGAGGLFVRLPFYLEGALQGAVAAVVALVALFALYRLGLPIVREPLGFLLGRAEVAFFGPMELAAIVGTAVLLGFGGAVLSLVSLGERS
jgi:cell division transport system permease protein